MTQEILEFLKKNLKVQVQNDLESDYSWGERGFKSTVTVRILLREEIISEDSSSNDFVVGDGCRHVD